jgi:hypothetical protein
MTRISQSGFRSFAPAVLAASLLFLGVSDASASCLAAWLCPPPSADDCASAHRAGASWQGAPEVCSFEARVDRASQKLNSVQLPVFDEVAVRPDGISAENLQKTIHAFSAEAADHGPPLPLYRLQAALLL